MEYINSCLQWKSFVQFFRFLCVSSTVAIIIYWIFEFSKDEHISAIEYKTYTDINDLKHLEFTICLQNPFIESRLKEFDANLNSTLYMKYLTGQIDSNETYKHVSFDKVTINPYDHIALINVWKTKEAPLTCNDLAFCPYIEIKNNINAFEIGGDSFYKCFGLQVKDRFANNVKSVQLAFRQALNSSLANVMGAYVMFNYPQQAFKPSKWRRIWSNLNQKSETNVFTITSLEMIRRRNKRNEQCLQNWLEYDNHIIRSHLEQLGCKPPYISINI